MKLDNITIGDCHVLFTGRQHWFVRSVGKNEIKCYNNDIREADFTFTEKDVNSFFRWPGINDKMSEKRAIKSVTINYTTGCAGPMVIEYNDGKEYIVKGRNDGKILNINRKV